uniref:Transposase n=1 Tax=Heterorhabditis bacteriophora TaxID=37862 RepID=A0A1I7X6G1_HETBA
MGRASTLNPHVRGQIKVLSTTGYTVEQIADVKCDWEKVRLLRDVLGHRLVPHVQRFPGVINRNGSCTDY